MLSHSSILFPFLIKFGLVEIKISFCFLATESGVGEGEWLRTFFWLK